MSRSIAVFFSVLMATAFAVPAQAAIITNLHNTGVNAVGAVLPDGVDDPNYAIISVPAPLPNDPTNADQTRTSARSYPIGPWLGDDTLSRWIGPKTDASLDGPPGLYTYRTTFTTDFTGTAKLVGQWSTDNEGWDILLNGIPILPAHSNPIIPRGLGTTSQPYSFTKWWGFNFTGAVVLGTNNLDFVVMNDADGALNPTALRVEFDFQQTAASSVAIPEPSTLAIWAGLGALSLVIVLRRRK